MKRLMQFIKECRNELVEKTTWPSKEDVLDSTVVVVLSIIIISAALFAIDFLVNWVVENGLRSNIKFLRTFINAWSFVILIIAMVVSVYVYGWLRKKIADR